MASIDVDCTEKSDGWTCDVTVSGGSGSSRHSVNVPGDDYEQLVESDTSVEELVESSFEFLLDREPKESILSQFDIMTISRYFPEYPDTIGDYL